MATPRNDTVGGDWTERLFITLWSPLIVRALRQDDDQMTVRRKTILLSYWGVTATGTSLILLIAIITGFVGYSKPSWQIVTMLLVHATVGIYMCCYLLKRQAIPRGCLKWSTVGVTCWAILGDFISRGFLDGWIMGILCMTLHAALASPEEVSRGRSAWVMKAIVVIWLVLAYLNDVYDFGLWNAHYIQDFALPARPRLSARSGIWKLLVSVIVIHFSSLLGRQAARIMFAEQEKQEAAVGMARSIAQALVRFDLEAAETLVSSSECCPLDGEMWEVVESRPDVLSSMPELADAFRALLANLRRYRPFLPDALFVTSDNARALDGAVGVDIDESDLADKSAPRSLSHSSPKLGLGLQKKKMSLLSTRLVDSHGGYNYSTAALEFGGRFVSSLFGVIRSAGGTVQNFDATCVMVSFASGAGVLSRDLSRACDCAMSVLDTLTGMMADSRDVMAGVAVAFGDCLVGNVGDDARRAFQILGRPADLARAIAPQGPATLGKLGVLCDGETAEKVGTQGFTTIAVKKPPQGEDWSEGGRWAGVRLFQIEESQDCPSAMLRKEQKELQKLPEHLKISLDLLTPPQAQNELSGTGTNSQGWVTMSRGQFGRVYAAHLRTVGDDVAVKELLSTTEATNADPFSARIAFLREIINLYETPVTQVLRFYGWAPGSQGQMFMVTELCGRGSLSKWLGALNAEERGKVALHVTLSVGRGLAYMHSVLKVHMDIAARNVLVTRAGELRLADLGLLTAEGGPAPVIAICWSPPESVLVRAAQRQASKAHDLWAFGCLLFEVLSAVKPWSRCSSKYSGSTGSSTGGSSAASQLRAVVQGLRDGSQPGTAAEIPALSDPLCAKLWEHIVLRLWQREPEARPEMRTVLEEGMKTWKEGGQRDLAAFFARLMHAQADPPSGAKRSARPGSKRPSSKRTSSMAMVVTPPTARSARRRSAERSVLETELTEIHLQPKALEPPVAAYTSAYAYAEGPEGLDDYAADFRSDIKAERSRYDSSAGSAAPLSEPLLASSSPD
eukprot:Hpha_TRINITY_DN5934_c0_g1::TRINITY_DN5934_c0_g1_i1::g.147311::m.147311